jgi:hypothetical protein
MVAPQSPTEIDTSLPVPDSAMMHSGIPRTNPKIINKKLRKVKELKTPLTSFNQREK